TVEVDGIKVTFAIAGDCPHEVLRKQFCEVLRGQQQIAGKFPGNTLLVSVLPATIESCRGTSLTDALNVNIPIGEKLVPFNFAVIGTCSHELFHQWNAYFITPKDEDDAFLFREGFTNYFAVATLTRMN